MQMQMPVRVAGPGGVVPDHGGLDVFDRHLHLPPTWPDRGRGVLGDPADDLSGGLAVDGDLDEPQRGRVITHPTLLTTAVEIDPGDPLLVTRR
jgi:hypothetical protein